MELTEDMLNELSDYRERHPYSYYIVKGMRGTHEDGYHAKISEKFTDYDEAKNYYDSLDLTTFYAGRELEYCGDSDEIEQESGDLIDSEYIDEIAKKMGDCDLCCRDKSFETYYVFKRGRKQELFSCISCWKSTKQQLENEGWEWTLHYFPGPAFYTVDKDEEEGEKEKCEEDEKETSEEDDTVEEDVEKDTPVTLDTMSIDEIKYHLDKDGYVVVPNVLNKDEVEEYKTEFFKWFNNAPGLKEYHAKHETNGIFKFYEVAHQRFAWLVRTNPKVVDIFKSIWETDDLVTSFDGACYYPEEFSGDANYWIHTDQSSRKVGRHCVQSFVSFTENVDRTFVLYHGSHYLHQDYFNLTGIDTTNDWCVLEPEYLRGLQYRQKHLHVKPGSLVLWDSRVFHQNTCGPPDCHEERLVQYVCYLPRNHEKNTEVEHDKRRNCFLQRINTSHWPYPVREVPRLPTWLGSDNLSEYVENYNKFCEMGDPYIDDLREKIEKLL